jgi:hypothetical protein
MVTTQEIAKMRLLVAPKDELPESDEKFIPV